MVLLSIVVLDACTTGSGSSGNTLSLGRDAKAQSPITLTMNGEMNLNGKSKEEVLNYRKKYVAQHPELLAGDYQPDAATFGNISDGKDWWGIQGQVFHSMGSIPANTGLARDSIYLFNPFWLVAPNIIVKSVMRDATRFHTIKEFSQSHFPTLALPKKIVIYPNEAREEFTYNVLDIYNRANEVTAKPIQFSNINFDLFSYNAKDFGYKYLYIDPNKSSNINKYPNAVIPISECFDTRSVDSVKCNEAFPIDEKVTGFNFKSLPARLQINLWKDKPASSVVKPDFTVTLNFE